MRHARIDRSVTGQSIPHGAAGKVKIHMRKFTIEKKNGARIPCER